MTTRMIGAIIMVHGDNSGLVLPPRIAPTQAVIIPIQQRKEGVLEKADELFAALKAAGIRVKVDDTDRSPGFKFAEQEMRGIPVRIECGPKDIENGQAVICRRDTREKYVVSFEELAAKVQEVLDKGEAYIQKIHASNDAIPGEEISAKIARMEQNVEQIFQRAEEHPEIIPDLKKMMDYYLPMTVKLLDAYEEMDRQPIQGETIRSSKKEIEDTLDTLNEAFAKLLDSVFQDTAWDVSSDISVLHTMLAQEGLTGNDFSKKQL